MNGYPQKIFGLTTVDVRCMVLYSIMRVFRLWVRIRSLNSLKTESRVPVFVGYHAYCKSRFSQHVRQYLLPCGRSPYGTIIHGFDLPSSVNNWNSR